MERRLTLPNDIETIPQLNEFIDNIAEEAGLDMSFTMSLNLALEEAVVNVMTYAYPEGTAGTVDIDIKTNGEQLTCVLSDSGTPFDPTQTPDADTTLSAEERPIGGLGIFLVRQIMDDISYQYVDNKNVLTLTKTLNNEL
ncbi:MAG: ATP-binding protein [Prevotella sp.]|nr:ATP-binding protein [Prevotella sp.]